MHLVQTDSFTDVTPTTAPPVFPLKPSDISSELLIDLWILTNIKIGQELQRNYTPAQAVENIRTYFGVPKYPSVLFGEAHGKLRGAAERAEQFRDWTGSKKVAD